MQWTKCTSLRVENENKVFFFLMQICTIDLDVDELAQFGIQLFPTEINWGNTVLATLQFNIVSKSVSNDMQVYVNSVQYSI